MLHFCSTKTSALKSRDMMLFLPPGSSTRTKWQVFAAAIKGGGGATAEWGKTSDDLQDNHGSSIKGPVCGCVCVIEGARKKKKKIGKKNNINK